MPFLAVLAGLALILVYLWLCGFAFVFLSVPGMLAGAAVGAVLGLGLTLVVAWLKLFGEQDEHVLRPADVVARRLPLLRVPAAVEPDRAWPVYFAGQVLLDLCAIAELAGVWALSVVLGAGRAARAAGWVGAAFWPLLLPFAAALAAFAGGALAGLVVTAAVLLVVTAVAWVFGLLAVGALRTADRAATSVRRSAGNCPRCYEVSRRPAYRCHGPGADLHRDIRPGVLGVFARRCGCGRRLPTMVLRAGRSPRLTAVCPLCETDLHAGAGAATDLRVPVFGAPSSGKTHLITAAVVGLLRAGPHPAPTPASASPPRGGDVSVALADEHSERAYEEFAAIVDAGGSAAKTDAAHQPIAVTLRLRQGRREALLHLYDAAGEALDDPHRNEDFHYLDTARTLVFVLDPFALPEIRARFADRFQALFEAANVAADLPEPSYQATVTRLRRYSVPTGRKRLAFVVSKRDLLRRLPGMAKLDHSPAGIRLWLVEQGADNLVTAAERDFGAVSYFLVSALDTGPDGPVAPFRWLLRGEPVPLPAQRAPASDMRIG
jgi:hypothetical protein